MIEQIHLPVVCAVLVLRGLLNAGQSLTPKCFDKGFSTGFKERKSKIVAANATSSTITFGADLAFSAARKTITTKTQQRPEARILTNAAAIVFHTNRCTPLGMQPGESTSVSRSQPI